MLIITDEISKSKAFEQHLENLNSIASRYGYTVECNHATYSVNKVENEEVNGASVILDGEVNEFGERVLWRFAVIFPELWKAQNLEDENKVIASISNAKNCVDALNEYLDCMKDDLDCKEAKKAIDKIHELLNILGKDGDMPYGLINGLCSAEKRAMDSILSISGRNITKYNNIKEGVDRYIDMSCENCSKSLEGIGYLYSHRCVGCDKFRKGCNLV